MRDAVYPAECGPFQCVESDVCGQTDSETDFEGNIQKTLSMLKHNDIRSADYFWIGAVWFPCNEDWSHGTGNWTVNKDAYPDGLTAVSRALAKQDMKLLLWYDPEVVYQHTAMWETGKTHAEWMIDIGAKRSVWNYANEEALDYVTELISKSIGENGVSCYRQDFTIAPSEYWRWADEHLYDGRTGICENHYITNMYCFLDRLRNDHPGLVVDNCASGGRRLDLEMQRRSIPFWRSDYNCAHHDDLDEAATL